MKKNRPFLILLALLAFGQTVWAQWEGSGTQNEPYQIATADDWNTLVTNVNDGTTYSGQYFQLTASFSVNTMVGTNDHRFCGIFDGSGNTLTVNLTATAHVCAPFRFIDGATIQNLRVDGSIDGGSSYRWLSGLVGDGSTTGTNTISNCVVNARISSTYDYSLTQKDCNVGGLIANISTGTTHIEGCAFTGEFYCLDNKAKGFGGLVSWRDWQDQNMATLTLTNCIFAPSLIVVGAYGDSQPLVRSYNNASEGLTITNCYFTRTLYSINNTQGYQVYSVTGYGGVGVSMAGTPTITYPVSTLSFYGSDGGFTCNGNIYGATGNMLSLNLNGSLTGYLVSVGTLSGSDNPYTLTMVSANAVVFASWMGSGTGDSPWQIGSQDDWNKLAKVVNDYGFTGNGKFFILTDNISIAKMVGSNKAKSFQGTFDGDGKTITLLNSGSGVTSEFGRQNGYSPQDRLAPFRYVAGVTIKNLTVVGDIYTGRQFASGLIARAEYGDNDNLIENVVVSVNIHSSKSGDGTHGGFVGVMASEQGRYCTNTFNGCVFNGKILTEGTTATTSCGGFVGWCEWNASNGYCSVVFNNCLVNPSAEGVGVTTGCKTFARCRKEDKSLTINNSYYTQTIGDPQGKLGLSNAAVSPVGDAISPTYTVSGLTAYGNGIQCGSDFYYDPERNLLREVSGYNNNNNNGGWVFIASPVSGSIAPDAVANIFSATDYDLYRFNQSSDQEWENYKANTSDFNLDNGQGYLYATKEDATLVFSGTFNTATEPVAVPLTYDANAEFAGWNLVGNPFADSAYVNRPFYKMNSEGSTIVAVDNYDSYSPVKVPPCTGIMVQAENEGETVTFSATEPANSPQSGSGSLHIALSQAASSSRGTKQSHSIDNAIVSFNEGTKLGKLYFGQQDANIYIPQDGKDYAIACAGKRGEIPLNFKANENSEYTITVNPEGVEMSYLHLIDDMTGADIDLLPLCKGGRGDSNPTTETFLAGEDPQSLTPAYTFTAKTTDYESRFRLVFSTDCEDADGDNDNFAFIDANGNIIVNGEGTLQIVDMLGRVVVQGDVKYCVSTDGIATGVYVLRLIEGEKERTQKIVIR